MNVILILVDSLNKHMLAPWNDDFAEVTPNMKRFAERALRFDNHYVGSLPCMPARREIYSGRKDFLWRPWGHLEAFDQSLPREVGRHGVKTQLVTDHYHYWEEGAHGYLESFQGEEDFFPAKVFSAASRWIEDNHGAQPYFLQVESFDVHEPFHCPKPYQNMWTEHVNSSFNCWPPYQDEIRREAFFGQTTPGELEFIRSQYMGKLSMVDHWLGNFMDTLDRLSVWEDTVVILTSDHGHDLGQRKAFGKQFPHWDSHANIPLLIRHPSFPKQRVTAAMTSTVDIYATILELFGVTGVELIHSLSLMPLVQNQTHSLREALLFGTFGTGACVTDGQYVLMQGYDNENWPLNMYTGRLVKPSHKSCEIEGGHFIPGVNMPVWRIQMQPRGSMPNILVSRGEDIGQETNLAAKDARLLKRMQTLLADVMKQEGCPEEQFERLGLAVHG